MKTGLWMLLGMGAWAGCVTVQTGGTQQPAPAQAQQQVVYEPAPEPAPAPVVIHGPPPRSSTDAVQQPNYEEDQAEPGEPRAAPAPAGTGRTTPPVISRSPKANLPAQGKNAGLPAPARPGKAQPANGKGRPAGGNGAVVSAPAQHGNGLPAPAKPGASAKPAVVTRPAAKPAVKPAAGKDGDAKPGALKPAAGKSAPAAVPAKGTVRAPKALSCPEGKKPCGKTCVPEHAVCAAADRAAPLAVPPAAR